MARHALGHGKPWLATAGHVADHGNPLLAMVGYGQPWPALADHSHGWHVFARYFGLWMRIWNEFQQKEILKVRFEGTLRFSFTFLSGALELGAGELGATPPDPLRSLRF